MGILEINSSSSDSISVDKNTDISLLSLARIKSVIEEACHVLIHSFELMPTYFMFLVSAFSVIIVGIALWHQKGIFCIFEYLILLLGCSFAPFSYGLVTSVSYTPRVVANTFIVMAMACVSIVICGNIVSEEIQISDKVWLYTVAMICAIIYVNVQVTVTDTYICQSIDTYEAKTICGIITDYENETGITVTTIASCGGGGTGMDTVMNCSETLRKYNQWEPFHRIVYDVWGQGNFINYVNDKRYKARSMTEDEIKMYFGEYVSSGQFEPKEQIVFEGNTMYWRIY